MNTRQIRLVAPALSALLALTLAACGANSGPAASAPTAAPIAATTAAPAASSPEVPAAASSEAPTADSALDSAASFTRLNLNEATEAQLLGAIPDFSGRMVHEFFEYRPYISIQQFRREIGKYVSAEQVAAYEQYVYVPIDVDAADAATLQQLPDVEASEADALIAARPFGANDAFLSALTPYVSADQLATAAAYLATK